jgi:hypothetical protein
MSARRIVWRSRARAAVPCAQLARAWSMPCAGWAFLFINKEKLRVGRGCRRRER